MKSLMIFCLLVFPIGMMMAQVNTQKKVTVTQNNDGKAHIKIVTGENGKETVFDTIVALDHGNMPVEIEKMIRDGKPGQRKIMIELDSTMKHHPFDFEGSEGLQGQIDRFRKNMDRNFPRGFNPLEDEDMLKNFNFRVEPDNPMPGMHWRGMMSGRLHKLSDEEFTRLRSKGVFSDKEDLAEPLDVRYVNLASCGADAQVLNFVSKEKGKITVAVCDKEGKVTATTEATPVSAKTVNGRNVYSCLIINTPDQRFGFLKLSKEGKLTILSNGF